MSPQPDPGRTPIAGGQLAGKIALVTGGTTGIGRALAQGLQREGAHVYISGRNSDVGLAAAAEDGSTYLQADVTDSASVDALVKRVVDEQGRLDIAVNSAGVGKSQPAEETTDEIFDRIFATNIRGLFFACRAQGRAMLGAGAGSIINVASMSAHVVNRPQKQSVYNASKAAAVHLTRSLAAEWADRGVRVNSISPGYTATAMTARNRAIPERADAWLAHTPLQRFAEPEEMVSAVVMLAGDGSSFMTGADLVIDGGYSLW